MIFDIKNDIYGNAEYVKDEGCDICEDQKYRCRLLRSWFSNLLSFGLFLDSRVELIRKGKSQHVRPQSGDVEEVFIKNVSHGAFIGNFKPIDCRESPPYKKLQVVQGAPYSSSIQHTRVSAYRNRIVYNLIIVIKNSMMNQTKTEEDGFSFQFV